MSRLTPREIEVLKYVAAGKTTREIGMILGRSPRTIEKHRASVMAKLGIYTAAGLAVFYNCEICKHGDNNGLS